MVRVDQNALGSGGQREGELAKQVAQVRSSQVMLPYVEARLRRAASPDLPIVSGSTPVVAFGDFTKASVATLGLNPSRQEFLYPTGNMLDGPARRFETLSSLGVESLTNASSATLMKVIDNCAGYFDHGRNPYMRWFGQLEQILRKLRVSYMDRTACHLDLVQWATDPVWSGLSDSARRQLLTDDVPFLLSQLGSHQVRLLLLNGRRVVDELTAATGFVPKLAARLQWGTREAGVYTGWIGDIRLVGWSPNLQSSFGITTQFRDELGALVANLARAESPMASA